eukprot:1244652-Amphidinium_carterae.1
MGSAVCGSASANGKRAEGLALESAKLMWLESIQMKDIVEKASIHISVMDLNLVGLLRVFAIVAACFWTIDFLVGFQTGFYVRGELNTKHKAIVSNYLKTWCTAARPLEQQFFQPVLRSVKTVVLSLPPCSRSVIVSIASLFVLFSGGLVTLVASRRRGL